MPQEPKRMPPEERNAPPRPNPRTEPKKKDERPAPKEPQEQPAKPHVEVIENPDETPAPPDAPGEGHAFAEGEEAARRLEANFKPNDGTSWDDPDFAKARDVWAAEVAKLAKAPTPTAPGQMSAAQVRDLLAGKRALDAPPVRVVQPETIDQQTPQMSDAPVAPGNMRKVEVASTDPSAVQTQKPAGQIADGGPFSEQDLIQALPGLAELIAKQVQAAVAGATKKGAPPVLAAPNPFAIPWQPSKYLVHYRNDVQPQKRVIRRSVDKDSDALYDDPAHKGQDLQFIQGHFFATEQWQVDLLNWMMKHPTHDHAGSVVGGDPAIWIDDDDTDVLYCPECRTPFASSSKLAAHRKATHNVAA